MKRIFSVVLIILLLLSFFCTALAAGPEGGIANPQSSLYLGLYEVDLVPVGNGQMAIEMSVTATGMMTKLGVLSLYIEQKINGSWVEFDTVYGVNHSDFYAYNDVSYLGEYFFNGVAGRQYRVTMTAYARNSTGSDTGEVTSGAATCRNP